ncbi:Coiled-coil domain-containing protein 6 [Branchiostoma belcheri]|nr:Coiled-coil domain-containing protein 6 [Branchiostoma belcheri]
MGIVQAVSQSAPRRDTKSNETILIYVAVCVKMQTVTISSIVCYASHVCGWDTTSMDIVILMHRVVSPYFISKMADSASEMSESESTDGGGSKATSPTEELHNRISSLQQENRVLKIELETFRMRCKALQEENKALRKASVSIVSCPRLG